MSPNPTQQRFDDRLATILAIDTSNQSGANSLWNQLVDLLAQGRDQLSSQQIERALAALAMLRQRVDLAVRQQGAAAIARRCGSAPLVVLLAGDAPSVVCALFDRLQLAERDWLLIMPMVGPLARSRLRLRVSELPLSAARALSLLAAGDYALPLQPAITASVETSVHAVASEQEVQSVATLTETAPASDPTDSGEDMAMEESPSNIAELVRRIDDWQRRRPANDAMVLPTSPTEIKLSIDSDGIVRSAAGMPNAALCGLSLAEPAQPEATGVDAGVARAFARRAPITNGRLYIAVGMPWSGLWTLIATPLFDAETGRFQGYRGTIHPAERLARADTVPLSPPAAPPLAEAMRQMVHELRSPLNAISGFSQLIEGQYFGPVASNYRAMAQGIRRDAASLLQVFDDLDLAARLDLGSSSTAIVAVDLVAAVNEAVVAHEGPQPSVESTGAMVKVQAAPEPLRALLTRLIALTSVSTAGDPPVASLRTDAARRLAILELTGLARDNSDQDRTTPMGQDFSMRLIEQLAINAGATIDFSDGKAILNFPAAMEGSERVGTAAS